MRKSIAFPGLRDIIASSNKAVPGTRIPSSPFEVAGVMWEVALYPYGAGESYANRVGVYLKLLDVTSRKEVDATFALNLRVLTEDWAAAADDNTDDVNDDTTRRGLAFRCGMTFCGADEAGESIGRCEDWGAHLFSTEELIAELEGNRACVAAVDLELDVWEQRPCKAGSSLAALQEQTKRLPRGSIRVGEVAVALSGGATAPPRAEAPYTCVPGVEYRILRIAAADGSPRFSVDISSEPDSTVYLLPTSKAARGDDEFAGELAGARPARGRNTVASILLDDDATGSSLPGAALLRKVLGEQQQQPDSGADEAGGPAVEATWGRGTKWPVGVPVSALPPLGSRLGFRALPDRLGYAIKTSGSVVLLLAFIALWPIWGGFAVSQLASAYAIPSRSMEATLRVGDVVLAEKLSRIANLPYASTQPSWQPCSSRMHHACLRMCRALRISRACLHTQVRGGRPGALLAAGRPQAARGRRRRAGWQPRSLRQARGRRGR